MRIALSVNGEKLNFDVSPLDRLLDILRTYRGLTGTKEGCGEGECGACAVILDGRLVNSCMIPAMELHGSKVLTVEGLEGEGDLLQRAFVEEGAVQCGFCTPGMVMASRALLARRPNPTREEIKEGLAGNLCRCTGYEKIIKAVSRAADEGYGKIAKADLDFQEMEKPSEPAGLSEDEMEKVFLPYDLDEACQALSRFDDVYMLAGTTDFYPDLKKGKPVPGRLMDLTHICELKKIDVSEANVIVGSGVTTQRIAEDPAIAKFFPALREAADSSAAIAIKNRATLGGNLMTASPAADMPPVLLMLGAKAVLRSSSGRREVPMDSLFKGYRETVRRPDELLESVMIPIPKTGTSQAFFKRGSRKSLTISRVNVACSARLEDGVVRDMKVVAGTMSILPSPLVQVSEMVEGKPITASLVEAVREAARDGVHPRTSEGYRKNITGNMVARFLSELGQGF
ncbi:FAD binding domain-containing protein [Dethiosulfovibrio sp. F2B]|uniref:FAD binding domain-containing protein n=1 Tax=Dethiosulfovibrio faecalis TaxID=2720018 RepID=UPI001F2390D1|nr:FAD binding domain-containing protein [Dethiosulfovibrio faecalis]MCF4151172.1 FAD binding domain-containing protein [Dethiosulfovibrio faecalis]